jgi:hypothetical protein
MPWAFQRAATASVEGTPIAQWRTPSELAAIPGKPGLQAILTISHPTDAWCRGHPITSRGASWVFYTDT